MFSSYRVILVLSCVGTDREQAARDANNGNVGAWCGLQVGTAAECVGDEVVYAEFAQAGTALTGAAKAHVLPRPGSIPSRRSTSARS